MATEKIENPNEYGADQIQILEGLEAVRKRPGMYIASTSSKGLHHLVWEIVDNGIDEAMAGYASTVTVTVDKDNIITVEDGVKNGGLGSAVSEWMNDHNFTPHIVRLGLPDTFVEQGTVSELKHLCGIDVEGIEKEIIKGLHVIVK